MTETSKLDRNSDCRECGWAYKWKSISKFVNYAHCKNCNEYFLVCDNCGSKPIKRNFFNDEVIEPIELDDLMRAYHDSNSCTHFL